MTNEEILSRLKEIKEAVDNDTTIKKEDSVGRQNAIDAINLEIMRLREKLASDDNYILPDYLDVQDKILKTNNQISELNDVLNDLENTIKEIENYISNIDSQLDDRKATLVEERNIVSYNFDENIATISPRVSELNREIEEFEQVKQNYESQLQTLTTRKEEVEAQLSNYNSILAMYNETNANYANNYIDEEKKEADRKQIELLTKRIEYLNNPNIMVDFSSELTALIDDYENGNLTEKGVDSRLIVLSTKYPTKEEEQVRKDLVAVEELSNELTMQMSVLEDRINDEINYTPSRLQKDSLTAEITDLQRNYNNYDITIPNLSASIKNQQKNKDYVDESIEECKEIISDLENNNRLLGIRIGTENLTTKEVEHLVKKINDNKRQIKKVETRIEKYRKTSNNLALSIKSLESDKKNFESLKQQTSKRIEEVQKLLDDTVHVDVSEREKEQKKYACLQEEMALLTGLAAAIQFDYSSKIEQLRKDIALAKEQAEEVIPVPTDLMESEPSELEQENTEEQTIVPLVADLNEKEISEVAEEVVEKEENVPVPIVMWKKATKKLVEKVKDKVFVRRVKAGVAALIIGLGIATLSKCSKEETIVEDIPTISDDNDYNNDIVYDSLNDSNYEDLFESLPKPSENESKEEIKEEVKEDVVKPKPKPVVKPTPAPENNKVEEIKPTTPEIPNPSDIPSIEESKPSQDIIDKDDSKPSQDIIDKDDSKPSQDIIDKEDSKTDFDDKDDIDNSEPVIPDVTPEPDIDTPSQPNDLETLGQQIEEGNIGVVITGAEENPTITTTDNSASEAVQAATNELMHAHKEELKGHVESEPEFMTSIEDMNVTELHYDDEGTINIEAKYETPTEAPTLVDTVETLAEEQYGTSYEDLSSLFQEINAETLEETTLENEGRSR